MSRERTRARFLVALGLIVGVGAGAAFTPTARAHLSFSSYVWHDTTNQAKHEPVNMFFTINGTNANTVTHIGHHGWNTFVCGGTLWFFEHTTWQTQNHMMATGGYCDAVRDHIRTNQSADDGGSGFGTFSLGAAHYEDRPGGCHGVVHRVLWNGFNIARDDLASSFTGGGHSSNSYFLGNTDLYVQCDGVSSQSDGWAYRLVIP